MVKNEPDLLERVIGVKVMDAISWEYPAQVMDAISWDIYLAEIMNAISRERGGGKAKITRLNLLHGSGQFEGARYTVNMSRLVCGGVH
jgi:hypothetical protein